MISSIKTKHSIRFRFATKTMQFIHTHTSYVEKCLPDVHVHTHRLTDVLFSPSLSLSHALQKRIIKRETYTRWHCIYSFSLSLFRFFNIYIYCTRWCDRRLLRRNRPISQPLRMLLVCASFIFCSSSPHISHRIVNTVISFTPYRESRATLSSVRLLLVFIWTRTQYENFKSWSHMRWKSDRVGSECACVCVWVCNAIDENVSIFLNGTLNTRRPSHTATDRLKDRTTTIMLLHKA